jgi:hypothetical protein
MATLEDKAEKTVWQLSGIWEYIALPRSYARGVVEKVSQNECLMKESARMVRRTRRATFGGIDQSLVEHAFILFFMESNLYC